MPDEADPPRKHYGFKEREFKRDNALTSAEPPPPTAKELAIMSGHKIPPASRPAAGTAKEGPPSIALAKEGDPNDVYAVLQANRAVEQNGGLNEVEIKEQKSRRKRDYWLILISSEVVLGTLAVLGRGNPFVLACSIAAMGLVAFGLTWIMWQVMNKY